MDLDTLVVARRPVALTRAALSLGHVADFICSPRTKLKALKRDHVAVGFGRWNISTSCLLREWEMCIVRLTHEQVRFCVRKKSWNHAVQCTWFGLVSLCPFSRNTNKKKRKCQTKKSIKHTTRFLYHFAVCYYLSLWLRVVSPIPHALRRF